MSGVFFPLDGGRRGAAHTAADDIPIEELLAATGYGMHVQTEEITQQCVTAVAQSDGL
jgi:hypothetical protein